MSADAGGPASGPRTFGRRGREKKPTADRAGTTPSSARAALCASSAFPTTDRKRWVECEFSVTHNPNARPPSAADRHIRPCAILQIDRPATAERSPAKQSPQPSESSRRRTRRVAALARGQFGPICLPCCTWSHMMRRQCGRSAASSRYDETANWSKCDQTS